MPSIDTLVEDIHHVLDYGPRIDQQSFAGVVQGFGSGLALKIGKKVEDAEVVKVRPEKTLYMSEVGKPCHRQTWYNVHEPEHGEELQGKTKVKFLVGDLLEDAILMLAEAAGHSVERQQERCEFTVRDWTVRGRIDAVIDGCLVDVKTASKYSFEKFQRGLDDSSDAFGYRAQLHGYNHAMFGGGPDSRTRQGFLVIEKTSGDLAYVDCNSDYDVVRNVTDLVHALEHNDPPPRKFADVGEGTSGNRGLGVECSYCPYKHECWKDANKGRGLRTFIYSTGPKFLTNVVREPKVYEVP